jgi:proline iminopeptidase
MTWANLTADAEALLRQALRQALGFEQWAVLGHSFGGMVALEYALRYPAASAVDGHVRGRTMGANAAEVLTKRGYGKKAGILAHQRLEDVYPGGAGYGFR